MDVVQNNIDRQQDPDGEYRRLQGLADYHASVGDYARAQIYYERAANMGPDEPEPYVGLGVAAIQDDRLEDAEIAFRVACRLDPDCAGAYAGLGMVAQEQGDYKRGFDMYLKCLERDTDNLVALLGLFQTSCRMGSFAEVIHYLQVYLTMHPGDTSVMFSLAALYMKDGKFGKSTEVLSELLRLDPNHEDAANLLEELEHNHGAETQKTNRATRCEPQAAGGAGR